MSDHEFRDPSTPLTEAQAELRRQVLKQIENNPLSFEMENWEDVRYEANTWTEENPVCTTTRCIAGWAQYFSYGQVMMSHSNDAIIQDAIDLLGLTRTEYRPAGGETPLFFTDNDDALEQMRKLASE